MAIILPSLLTSKTKKLLPQKHSLKTSYDLYKFPKKIMCKVENYCVTALLGSLWSAKWQLGTAVSKQADLFEL